MQWTRRSSSPAWFAAAAVALLLLGAVSASAGCSSSDSDPASSADAGDAGTPYPAFTPPVPQAVDLFAGPTLKDFTVVPVLFAGDQAVPRVKAFLGNYAASPEWKSAVGEYGVGTMTIAPAIIVDEAPPTTITDAEIQAWLHTKVDGTPPAWGPADRAALAKTVFAIIYPPQTQVTELMSSSCTDFGGYHDWSPPVFDDAPDGGEAGALDAEAGALDAEADAHDANAKPLDPGVLYIVVPRCALSPLTTDETLTYALAHELLETATDPYAPLQIQGGAAYGGLDVEHEVWGAALHGAELADLCNTGSGWAPPSIGYTVSRSWSNAAARLYHDPCVPTPADEPYFNAFIETPDTFPLYGEPGEIPTKGITIRKGETKTFDVMLFSDRPTSEAWQVMTVEVPILLDGPRVLSLGIDFENPQRGRNGDILQLTVYASETTPTGTSAIGIVSKLGGKTTVWYTAVSIGPEL